MGWIATPPHAVHTSHLAAWRRSESPRHNDARSSIKRWVHSSGMLSCCSTRWYAGTRVSYNVDEGRKPRLMSSIVNLSFSHRKMTATPEHASTKANSNSNRKKGPLAKGYRTRCMLAIKMLRKEEICRQLARLRSKMLVDLGW